ncbi:TPA: DUF4752 family protein [Escherichia coli]|nr:DUF4752 family protein [Escherichia coli]
MVSFAKYTIIDWIAFIALALASFYEAFNLNSLQPGSVVVVTTQSGMTIQIHKPKEEGRG